MQDGNDDDDDDNEEELGIDSVLLPTLEWTQLPRAPPPSETRGWSPSSFVELVVMPRIAAETTSFSSSKGAKIAIDVGAGSGRDVAFLTSLGYSCFALDNRRPFLEKAVALSRRMLLTTTTATTKNSTATATTSAAAATALETHISSSLPFRESTADLILCVRFLERSLLPNLCRYLRVGGFLCYSHFLEGCDKTAIGQPKKLSGYVLHGELEAKCVNAAVTPKDLLPPSSCENDDDENDSSVVLPWLRVVYSEETTLADGRPIDNLLVMRVR